MAISIGTVMPARPMERVFSGKSGHIHFVSILSLASDQNTATSWWNEERKLRHVHAAFKCSDPSGLPTSKKEPCDFSPRDLGARALVAPHSPRLQKKQKPHPFVRDVMAPVARSRQTLVKAYCHAPPQLNGTPPTTVVEVKPVVRAPKGPLHLALTVPQQTCAGTTPPI